MLACVCQPADTGIFRRSPVPLGAPPLKINRGAIPKPGRTLRLSPVITSEPSAKNKQSSSQNSSPVVKHKKRHSKKGITTHDVKVQDESINAENTSNPRIVQNQQEDAGKSDRLEKVPINGCCVVNYFDLCSFAIEDWCIPL